MPFPYLCFNKIKYLAMYIKSISIKNFKGFDDIELSFENENQQGKRQWTVILGENGVGKSNLLKAIALIALADDTFLEFSDWQAEWIKIGADEGVIEATFRMKNELHTYKKIFTRPTFGKKFDNSSNKNIFIAAYGASRNLFLGNYLGTNEKQSRETLAVANLFKSNSPLYPITAWAMDLDYRKGERGLSIVRNALEGFLPEVSFEGIDKENRQLMFKTVDGVLSLDQLSDGYKNMAAWFGDLMFRITEHYKDIENPLLAEGILLLDELELHLHPSWQRKLYDFITEKLPNMQIIATTHSPLAAQQAGENELYALRRNEEHKIEILPFIGSPRKMLIHQLLMSPIFGAVTDEALSVEKKKNEFRASSTKEKKRGLEQRNIQEILPERPYLAMSEEQKNLLDRLEQHLNLPKP